MPDRGRLISIELDETGLAPPTPEVEQERRVALFDLLEESCFVLPERQTQTVLPGPYRLTLGLRKGRLVFNLATSDGGSVGEIYLSLTRFAQVIKDYHQICGAYLDAVRRLPPAHIEAIDMGRRGIHDEGARLLIDSLEGKVETDMPTARRLFTLVYVLLAQS